MSVPDWYLHNHAFGKTLSFVYNWPIGHANGWNSIRSPNWMMKRGLSSIKLLVRLITQWQTMLLRCSHVPSNRGICVFFIGGLQISGLLLLCGILECCPISGLHMSSTNCENNFCHKSIQTEYVYVACPSHFVANKITTEDCQLSACVNIVNTTDPTIS